MDASQYLIKKTCMNNYFDVLLNSSTRTILSPPCHDNEYNQVN